MKRTILSFALAIVGMCMIFSSCSSTEEAPLEFSFPGQITYSMGADESKSITIKPNAQWELALSKSAASHFYIADGDQKRQNMRGEAGEFQFEIKTTSTLDFENDITCEVTLTMKDGTRTESKVVATLTKNKAQRVVTLYAAKVEDGEFVEQPDGESSKTVYSSSAVGSGGINVLVAKDDIDDLEARFKVEANCAWTMILPEWLEANTLNGDASAAKEIVLKVNTELLPEGVYSGDIEFIATQSEASIKIVSISIDSEAIAKSAEIYPAQIANGEYVISSEGEDGPIYQFASEQLSGDHQMRVNAANITEIDALLKVVTNFKWDISAPEWIKDIEPQDVGESVVKLEVDYSKLPANGDVEGVLEIIDVAKSKTISTINLKIAEADLTPKVAVYPAVIEDGQFALPEGESDFAVVYDTNTVSDSGVQMIWPLGIAWANARIKVETNLPLKLNMPEWMTSGAELEVGVHELQLRADNTKLPKDATTFDLELIDAGKSEKSVVSTVKISYPGIDSFYSISGFETEVVFDVEGMTTRDDMPVDHVRGELRSVRNGATVWLVGLTVESGKYVAGEIDWATATLSEWDGSDLVQVRSLDIKANVNEGVAREAYLFVVPSGVEVKNADSFFVKKSGIPTGELVSEYKDYLITTIKQEGATIESTDLIYTKSIDESATLSTIKAHWLTYELPAGTRLSEIYTLTYTKSSDNENTLLASSKTIESFTYYCGNSTGTWVATDEASSWINVVYSGDGFKVSMDSSLDEAYYSKQSDSYVGGILIKFTDGTQALFVCTYNATTIDEGEEEEKPLIAYKWPDSAKGDKSTLVELKSGEWYDKYSSLGAPIFHLTYIKKFNTLSALNGISYEWDVEYVDNCDDWISYEPGVEYQSIFMNAFGKDDPKESDPIVNNNVSGVLIFRGDGEVKLVLICTLAIPE